MADRKVIQFVGTDGNDYDVRDEAAQQKIGTTALPTTAQTLTGAIAEHESDLTNQAAEVNSLKTAVQQTDTRLEEHRTESAELIAPLYSGDSYTGNPISLNLSETSIINVESSESGNILFCGKNMFDDSYMASLATENEHEFKGQGADFTNLPVYVINNACEGMIFSASMKPESDLSMEMVLRVYYTDGTNRNEYFYNFEADTWLRKSISLYRSGKTVASVAIICSAKTASIVRVKDIMIEKSASLSAFVPFDGGILSSESAYSKEGVNNFISSVADDVLTVTVLNNPLPQTNATKIAGMENDLYAITVTDSAVVESNRTVSSGTWGIIPLISAEEMEITPQFDITTGTYTVTHYKLSGDDQTLILVNSETYDIGETATFSNVSASDYYAISASGGYLEYRNDSGQKFVSKFAYISSGKAVDYANSQIAGNIVFKNRVPKADEKQFTGKTIVFFGDSRTWYDGKAYTAGTKPEWAGKICKGYQQTVIALTGCGAINKGFSGYTSAQICEQIKLYDFSLVDAVYLSGGVNDFIKQDEIETGTLQPIGGTFDTTTSYGAWQSAIEYLLTNYPQLKIYIDTPWVCWNWYGNILPESIAEVKKNVAELYSIECLDLYHISGINVINRDYFYVDDISGNAQSRLHMNDYGNEWIGNIIGKYILSY